MMKLAAFGFIIIGLMAAIPEADAAACRAGVYRSACISRYGATVRRHYPRYGANRCYWRGGRRIC